MLLKNTFLCQGQCIVHLNIQIPPAVAMVAFEFFLQGEDEDEDEDQCPVQYVLYKNDDHYTIMLRSSTGSVTSVWSL